MNFSEYLAKTGKYPVDLAAVKANGCYFFDAEGKKYIDLISGIGVSYIGHNHSHVISAVKDQIDHHMHLMVYGEFHHPTQAALAKKIIEISNHAFEQVFFTNSGTEANEGALKLAKRATGRPNLIGCLGAYHGSTHGSLSVSGNESRKTNFRPLLPGVSFIRYNQEEDLSIIHEQTAAVIIEPIQGDAGVRIPTKRYLTALRKRCDEMGTLLIMDEIQTGFGRTGKWFAHQHFEVIPDILTLGKSLGGGLPLGAFVAKRDLMELLTENPPLGHITTFGGNPVSCAAGLASIQVVETEHLLDTVEEKGAQFERLLVHPAIKEIRRKGLMIAVELESAEMTERVVLNSIQSGVLIYWFLSTKNCFRIAPPLTITSDQISSSCNAILTVIDNIL